MSTAGRNTRLVKAFLDPQYQFWEIQIGAWFGFALLTYFSLTLVFGQTEWPYLLHPIVQSIIGIFVSWPMRWIFRNSWHKPVLVRSDTPSATDETGFKCAAGNPIHLFPQSAGG